VLFEFRRYEIAAGRRDEWIEYMETVIIPFQISMGVVVLGSFLDADDPDVYFWMRRFADEADRERLYKAVYESDRWKNEISLISGSFVNRETIKIDRLIPTGRSVMH
jgi:NIPSNAP